VEQFEPASARRDPRIIRLVLAVLQRGRRAERRWHKARKRARKVFIMRSTRVTKRYARRWVFTQASRARRARLLAVTTVRGARRYLGAPYSCRLIVRDISALGAVPGMSLIEPFAESEVRAALDWAVHRSPGPAYLRLVSVPWALGFDPPDIDELVPGRGTVLRSGGDAPSSPPGP
jgi:hypothetical protein